MPLIPIKEEEKRHFLKHIICRFTDEKNSQFAHSPFIFATLNL